MFMAGRGASEKIDRKTIDEIVLMVKMGNYLETAAAYAGIHKATLHRWLKRGREEIERINNSSNKASKIRKSEELYVDLCDSVEKSLAEAEIRDVQIIYNACKADWKASAWRLERKYPERWGHKEQHEITGKDGGAVEVEMARNKLIKKLTDMSDCEPKEDTKGDDAT
jgi:hypothetical protein